MFNEFFLLIVNKVIFLKIKINNVYSNNFLIPIVIA